MRLIDADALKIDLTRFYDGEVVARKLIDEQPTVDAVPVVRCKDCRFSDWYTAVNGKRYCYCMETGASGRNENDFCSYGVKDGDGNG